jgi:hypothetical protein
MIQMRIKSWMGEEWDAILLSLRGLQMRVAVPGNDDAVELIFRGGQWFAENGEPVEITYALNGRTLSSPPFDLGVATSGPDLPSLLN